tara:strand:- start:18983 stop:19471 length:489 start_codon:yes stop_codon:yes gene_type:complete
MILSTIKTEFSSFVNTKANQITLEIQMLPNSVIRHLVKFTNDMSGEIIYVYPNESIYNRYTKSIFNVNSPADRYKGELFLTLAGYWKYEFWEVYFEENPMTFDEENSPKTELEILKPKPNHGIVKGLVAIGKMYAAEKAGAEEVKYKEYISPEKTNFIYNGE